ncbi:hypothetical protein 2 [Hubei sobemo-like virus 31]|uniref:hypothetical protein 2 n=1 Tax=Hubei sobemo-like virus 31 TaxID=1923218 RepID=UPI0009094FFF|nr:hypothetical protein 2 [Hubei sobemo-like virus 31]APG75916.1 hypothetical protein 2 [Hubei sobemo-like virus 31]
MRGERAELTSLLYHAQLRDDLVKSITEHEKGILLNKLEMQFRHAKWTIPSDFMKRSHFDRVLKNIDMTSSPGYPYLLVHTNNASFFNCKEGVLDVERADQIWNRVNSYIENKLSDPIRLFVKPEPHNERKMRSGRYRLISSVSIIDQIIDAMLFGEMNEIMIHNWPMLPTRVGWSPYYGGWKQMPYAKTQMAIDKTAWDWSVQGWLPEIVLELRKRLCRNLTSDWERLANWRYKALFGNPTLVTSGGLFLRQKQSGVMKSGCYNTIIDNSIMQIVLHDLVCQTLNIPIGSIIAMGDDTLQDALFGEERERYLEELSRYCNVKVCNVSNEFCGMHFNIDGRVEPVYRAKHAYKILYMDDSISDSMADSYTLMYYRSRLKDLIDSLFRKMGCEVRSDEYRDAIFG